MTGIIASIKVTETYAVGARGIVPLPNTVGDRMDLNGKTYLFVQANGAIAAADVVLVGADYQAAKISTTNSATAFGAVVAVSAATFADNEYGWVQIYGETTVNSGASCAANTALNSTGTAGRVDDDASAGAEIITGLVTTGTTTANRAAAWLNYPTVGATI